MEIGHDTFRPFLYGMHDRAGMLVQCALLSGIGPAADLPFEIAVEILVRIELGTVARKIEDLDGILVPFKPLSDRLAVMNLQVIQHQEDLAARIAKQAVKKIRHDLCVDRSLKDGEPQLSPIGYGTEHAQPFPLSLLLDNRSLALRRVPASSHVIAANPCLIAPVNLRSFFLRTLCNGRVILGKPTLNRSIVALVSSPDRPLRGEPPTLQPTIEQQV